MTQTHTPKPYRTTAKCRGPRTWAVARKRYQSGETATAIAHDLDLGRGNLYRRAAKEGWRKCDLPDLPVSIQNAHDCVNPQTGEVDIQMAARAAMATAARMIAGGQFASAVEAIKAVELMVRIADRKIASVESDETDVADRAKLMSDLHRKVAALAKGGSEDRRRY